MNEKDKFTFEDIFKQNEKRIYYHMHKLGIRDPDGEFYSEGLFALWNAYRHYEPQKVLSLLTSTTPSAITSLIPSVKN